MAASPSRTPIRWTFRRARRRERLRGRAGGVRRSASRCSSVLSSYLLAPVDDAAHRAACSVRYRRSARPARRCWPIRPCWVIETAVETVKADSVVNVFSGVFELTGAPFCLRAATGRTGACSSFQARRVRHHPAGGSGPNLREQPVKPAGLKACGRPDSGIQLIFKASAFFRRRVARGQADHQALYRVIADGGDTRRVILAEANERALGSTLSA